MNLILLLATDFSSESRVRLGGRRREHVIDIHRAVVGDRLRVGLLDGAIGEGELTAIDEEWVEMEVRLDSPPPPPCPVTVVLALPRPGVMRRVVQGLAAFGIKRIILLSSARVEKSYWGSPALRPEALREQLLLGLEQGCDTGLPVIEERRRFKAFVEDEFPALAGGSLALVAHPGAEAECPRGVRGPITLAIGPEGGFTDYEVDLLRQHGATPVSLGSRPLRVEQAVPALLGRLS